MWSPSPPGRRSTARRAVLRPATLRLLPSRSLKTWLAHVSTDNASAFTSAPAPWQYIARVCVHPRIRAAPQSTGYSERGHLTYWRQVPAQLQARLAPPLHGPAHRSGSFPAVRQLRLRPLQTSDSRPILPRSWVLPTCGRTGRHGRCGGLVRAPRLFTSALMPLLVQRSPGGPLASAAWVDELILNGYQAHWPLQHPIHRITTNIPGYKEQSRLHHMAQAAQARLGGVVRGRLDYLDHA